MQMAVHSAIEMFTRLEVKKEEILPLINHPGNAINIQTDAHMSMDHYLAWGIEARPSVNNEVRVIRLCSADPNMTLIVEILFSCCSAKPHCCNYTD